MLLCLLVFISGFLYEAGCVFWVHCTERGYIIWASLLSMLVAICQVVGIGESIHDLHTAPFFILGYGAGTAISVLIKRYLQKE